MKVKIKSKILNKYLYGIYVTSKKSITLAVFLSGLSGSKELPLFKNASREFLKNDLNTIRFNFCNDSDDQHAKRDALNPKDMSLSVYTTELKNLIDKFNKKRFKIVLIGHSFGTVISILFLKKYKKYRQNTKLILWDPTLLPWKKKVMDMDFSFDPKGRLYYGKNTDEILNEKFYKECINIKNTADILYSLNKKVCIVAAENGGKKQAKKYFSKIKDKKNSKLFIIKKAGHYFGNKAARKELFDKTIKFIAVDNVS